MPSKKSVSRRKENVDIDEKSARALKSFNVHIVAVRLHLATYQKLRLEKNAGLYLNRAEQHLHRAHLAYARLPEDLREQYSAEVSQLGREYQELKSPHDFADKLRYG